MAEFLAWFIIIFPFLAIAAHTIKGFVDDYRNCRR
jgi:hypothetical protein